MFFLEKTNLSSKHNMYKRDIKDNGKNDHTLIKRFGFHDWF